jgi:hypothetical protein
VVTTFGSMISVPLPSSLPEHVRACSRRKQLLLGLKSGELEWSGERWPVGSQHFSH